MRISLLMGLLLIPILGFTQTKYPVQTIYKGDSVVILSIKQSIDINKAIETQKRIIRDQSKKITLLNKTVDSLKRTAGDYPRIIDSIKYVADTTYKWADELSMTIREMAMYGSFVYMVPPYDKVYFVNLDDYNLYSHDNGSAIVLEKMTKQEYIDYKKYRKEHDEKFPSPVDYFKNLEFINFEDLLRKYNHRIWKNKNILEEELKDK